MIDELLDRYGREQFNGDGFVTVFMDKASRKSMQRDLGRQILGKLSAWLDTYKVRTTDGKTITIGHRYHRIQRI